MTRHNIILILLFYDEYRFDQDIVVVFLIIFANKYKTITIPVI